MTRFFYGLIFLFVWAGIAGCQQRQGLAPVYEAHGFRDEVPMSYRVQRYDTLYSIAFRYYQDYRVIAQINHLYPPYALRVGQWIRLKPNPNDSYSRVQPKPMYTEPRVLRGPNKPINRLAIAQKNQMLPLKWPSTERRLWASFAPEKGRKGIDVLGRSNSPVFAANSGVVAYAGDGLVGYGNLIIIKHNDRLLTAYAHSARVLVKEGQRVERGQKIATMGLLDRQHHGLHFEVREWGKPVNPLRYF